MAEPYWVRAYRVAFGLLALVAVARSYWQDDDSLANFLSKFTYQSNTYSALVFFGGVLLASPVVHSARWDRLRGAAVMYGLTTFLVYGFLIDGFDNPFDTNQHWTHTVLHQVMPIVLVLDLMFRPFAYRLPWRTTFPWTVYPIVFLAYSLIRGAITGWYPYDFIDPDEVGGYGGVALYSLAITIGFLAIGALIVWVSHWHHRAVPGMEQQQAAGPALHL